MVNGVSASYSYGEIEKSTRSGILSLEKSIGELPDAKEWEQLEEELNTHYFAPGVYGRQMDIPKGMCIVGKIHKHQHINIITSGVIKVVTEFGHDVYTAPRTWISEAGTKRAVYALEDTTWLCVHANPTDTTDIRELEDQLIAADFETFDRLQLKSGA
jgi:hypothetical protein